MTAPYAIWVTCAYADRDGADPLTIARFQGGSYFCAYCGATDHPETSI